jgi:hypothetical protein
MSKIFYLKNGALADLKSNINANHAWYQYSNIWLNDYFKSSGWYGEAVRDIASVDDIKLINPNSESLCDLPNTISVYDTLKNLPLSFAIDERFWSYLSHVVFWEYMRVRWPAGEDNRAIDKSVYIRDRYFFMPNKDRALFRNGISRLWWYGYTTYDAARENPYELTEVLLDKLDVAQQLLERSYSRNPVITKTILSYMLESKRLGKDLSDRNKIFRPLVKHLNAVGGVTILDSLSPDDLRELVVKKLTELEI